jgi:hypothetical protein
VKFSALGPFSVRVRFWARVRFRFMIIFCVRSTSRVRFRFRVMAIVRVRKKLS